MSANVMFESIATGQNNFNQQFNSIKQTLFVYQYTYICPFLRGISSVGRAFAWHAKGQRFEPAILHFSFADTY